MPIVRCSGSCSFKIQMFYLVNKGIYQSPDNGFVICLVLAFFFFNMVSFSGCAVATSYGVPCHRVMSLIH